MFSPATIESIRSYVYVLADQNDKIFYVGKGQGNRVFAHVEEVRRWLAENPTQQLPQAEENDDSEVDGMSLKQQRIAQLLRTGVEPAMYIVREGLTDEQALLIEAVLISVLDWQLDGALTTQIAGHGEARFGLKTVEELEATRGESFRVSDLPDFSEGEEAIAININQRWPEVVAKENTLLQASEGRWRVNVQRAKRCRYAIVHANGVVRGVFEIKSWSGPDDEGKFTFIPVHTEPMSDPKFSQKNASFLLGANGRKPQYPIRYVRFPQ